MTNAANRRALTAAMSCGGGIDAARDRSTQDSIQAVGIYPAPTGPFFGGNTPDSWRRQVEREISPRPKVISREMSALFARGDDPNPVRKE